MTSKQFDDTHKQHYSGTGALLEVQVKLQVSYDCNEHSIIGCIIQSAKTTALLYLRHSEHVVHHHLLV